MFFSLCFLFIRSIVFFLIQSHLFTYFSRFSSLAVNFLFFSYCLFFFTVDFSSPAVRGKVYRLFVFLFAPFFTFFLTQFIVFFFFFTFSFTHWPFFSFLLYIFSLLTIHCCFLTVQCVLLFFFLIDGAFFFFPFSPLFFFLLAYSSYSTFFFSLHFFYSLLFFFLYLFFSLLTVHFCSPAVREEVRPAECRQEAAPQVQPLEGEVC